MVINPSNLILGKLLQYSNIKPIKYPGSYSKILSKKRKEVTKEVDTIIQRVSDDELLG